jgi:Enoyl-CoA hydratase/carnithine racemase
LNGKFVCCLQQRNEALRLNRSIKFGAARLLNVAFETTLDQGLLYERRTWGLLAATEDKTEGMKAFVEKRPAVWKGK